MRHLLVSKPMLGLAALLLIVQMACVASSLSPTATAGAGGAGSSSPTQTSSSGSASTQSAPLGGGAQNTQSAPASGGQSSTQAAPTTSAGSYTQSVPSTGGQATQAMPTTSAGGQGTPAGAQALLSQVAQHYQTAGREQALKDFTDQTAPFNAPGMFVMCVGSDHKISAMGGFPLLVGFSADNLTEVSGQSLGNLIWDTASVATQGSIPFRWKNPLSGAYESKVLVYQKLTQDVCGVVANQP